MNFQRFYECRKSVVCVGLSTLRKSYTLDVCCRIYRSVVRFKSGMVSRGNISLSVCEHRCVPSTVVRIYESSTISAEARSRTHALLEFRDLRLKAALFIKVSLNR